MTGGGGKRRAIKRNLKMRIGHLPNDHYPKAERRGEIRHAWIKKTQAPARGDHWWEFLTGIIPHFEKCQRRGASLWIILIDEIQLCVWVCAKTRGGVGIVCHQMNSWGESNEECREKEGGILIGLPSLSLSVFFLSQGEQEIECWLYRGKKGFLTLAPPPPCPTNCSVTHPVWCCATHKLFLKHRGWGWIYIFT